MPRGLQRALPGCNGAPAPRRPPASLGRPLLRLARAALWLSLAAGSLAPTAGEMTVACATDVALPCPAPRDPQVSYSVSWAKVGAAMPRGLGPSKKRLVTLWIWGALWGRNLAAAL